MLRYLPFLLVLAMWIYAFIDCLNTPEKEVRKLPKVVWVIVILLFGQVLIGPVAWFIVGRPRRNLPYGAAEPDERRWVAPDDNPDFLKSLGQGGGEQSGRSEQSGQAPAQEAAAQPDSGPSEQARPEQTGSEQAQSEASPSGQARSERPRPEARREPGSESGPESASESASGPGSSSASGSESASEPASGQRRREARTGTSEEGHLERWEADLRRREEELRRRENGRGGGEER